VELALPPVPLPPWLVLSLVELLLSVGVKVWSPVVALPPVP